MEVKTFILADNKTIAKRKAMEVISKTHKEVARVVDVQNARDYMIISNRGV